MCQLIIMIPYRECSTVCSIDTALPNDIDQSKLDYAMEYEGIDLGPLLFEDRNPNEQLYYNED